MIFFKMWYCLSCTKVEIRILDKLILTEHKLYDTWEVIAFAPKLLFSLKQCKISIKEKYILDTSVLFNIDRFLKMKICPLRISPKEIVVYYDWILRSL